MFIESCAALDSRNEGLETGYECAPCWYYPNDYHITLAPVFELQQQFGHIVDGLTVQRFPADNQEDAVPKRIEVPGMPFGFLPAETIANDHYYALIGQPCPFAPITVMQAMLYMSLDFGSKRLEDG